MNESLNIAESILLKPAGLDGSQLDDVIAGLMKPHVDSADLYLQVAQREMWSLQDGLINEADFSIDRGVGIRAISGDKTGYAYADDLLLPALKEAASAAGAIARHGGSAKAMSAWKQASRPSLYSAIDPLKSISETDKVALLRRVDDYARQLDPLVCDVSASLAASHHVVFIKDSSGRTAADVRPLVRFNVTVIVEKDGKREFGSAGGGGRFDYQALLEGDQIMQYVNDAVRQALVNLDAVPAPTGMMPVVLGPGWPGVLLHEAVGHGLEGDFNRKGSSVFSGRIGERVATKHCTVIDDGTLPGRRGSLNMDDEGMSTGRTVLIEEGILKGYMHDQLSAKIMKTAPTGNGRRESYACMPLPRMTNTFMLAGNHDPEEIIASVDKGLYALNFSGGQVDITSGKFVFSTSEAYLIEKGKITAPVKGATLIGDGPEVLHHVSMVGNDLALDSGIGVCGKDGQSVPVGVGQPTLKVDHLTVGG